MHRLASLVLLVCCGCSAIPDVRHAVRVHNPFPQLKRVAILPFNNQSDEPTLDPLAVTDGYYAALQSVPGFEVLPVGVVRKQLQAFSAMYGPPHRGEDFQAFARLIGVDAVVQGSVTDYSPYYPPRMAMTVHWYAANPGFHPIPPGYGLPWGTKAEQDIPSEIVLEAEFELARQQLATQTPAVEQAFAPIPREPPRMSQLGIQQASATAPGESAAAPLPPPIPEPPNVTISEAPELLLADESNLPLESYPAALPPQWPDPSGLIPAPPQPFAPLAQPQHEPVLTHTRLYDGSDSKFTERLANFVSTSDDRRPTNWQGYLSRSDDFVRFCCRLHVTEMLEARGGADESDFILRWPIGRYKSQ